MSRNFEAFVKDLPVFQMLPEAQLKELLEHLDEQVFSFGSDIVSEGDEVDGLYVLLSGKARVVKKGQNGEDLPLNMLRVGEYFGEMSLLSSGTASATVRASGEVRILKLKKSIFDRLVDNNREWRSFFALHVRERSLGNFLKEHTAFSRLSSAAFTRMLSDLEEQSAKPGQIIVKQGETSGPMFFIKEGRARVYRDDEDDRYSLRFLRKGDYFGDLSLFMNIERTATVIADTAMELLKLSPETYQRIVEEDPEFKKQIEIRIAQYTYKDEARLPLDFGEEDVPADMRRSIAYNSAQKEEPLDFDYEEEEEAVACDRERIRKFPLVYQLDEMDCGAACLAMLCRHFGKEVSLARIRELTLCGSDGVSLQTICSAAETLGLAARSIKASKRNLDTLPLPAIMHWEGNHWIVLYDVRPDVVRVSDPALGLRKISRADFEEGWTGYTGLFDYTVEFEKAPEDKSSLKWLLVFFKPYMRVLGQCLMLSLLVSALQMALPVITQVIVDKVLVEADASLLNVVMGAFLFCIAFMMAASSVERYLMSFVATRIDAATLDFLTRKLLALPMHYFRVRRTGDIQRRLEGVRQVREFVSQNGVAGITAVTQLLASLGLMLLYSPLLTVVFLAVTPLYLLLLRFSSRWLKPLFDTIEDGLGKYHSHQIDALRGIETVKALGAERYFRERLLGEFLRIARKLLKANFTVLSYEAATQLVSFVSLALFLWIGAYQVLGGNMSVGALMAFNALVALANAPILLLLSLWDNYQFSAVLIGRLNDVFEAEPEQGRDHSKLSPVPTLAGNVRLQNVSFAYSSNPESKVLDEISFEAKPGQTVAIVGRSGSGKTTLLRCLAGLIEPSSGTIYFDNVDYRTLRYRDLRKHIGFVLQDNYLFDDTIAQNISVGTGEVDPDRLAWAAHIANIDTLVQSLPLGYDTKVGESGMSLSGGQKQRIAIARAVYNQPAIVILDEATSALDTESERAIQDNLQDLLKNRTCFVVAHRLSTVRNADMIVVLEKGCVVESGTHDQLMQRRGLYFYLCSQQIGT